LKTHYRPVLEYPHSTIWIMNNHFILSIKFTYFVASFVDECYLIILYNIITLNIYGDPLIKIVKYSIIVHLIILCCIYKYTKK